MYVSSNTTRGFAFLLDMLMLNMINLVFWVVYSFKDKTQHEVYTKFVDQAYHGAGEGLGPLFVETQLYVIGAYFIYSTICEISGLKSTIIGYYLGLRIKTIEGKSPELLSIVLRNLLKPISFMILPISFIFSYSNPERRWLHDKVASTLVEQEA